MELLTDSQAIQMLEALPASCVYDAIEKVVPEPFTNFARAALLNYEAAGIVSWRRDAPQEIALTDKGREMLEQMKVSK